MDKGSLHQEVIIIIHMYIFSITELQNSGRKELTEKREELDSSLTITEDCCTPPPPPPVDRTVRLKNEEIRREEHCQVR